MRQQPARPRVQRRWLILGAIIVVLFVSISSIVRFYTDLLWFDELKITAVFWKMLWTRVTVGVLGGVLAGVIVLANLEIARRTAPKYRFVTAGADLAEQYRSAFRPYARIANLGVAAVIAFFTGLSTSAMWDRFLLWQNAVPFGVKAPEPFGRDVSYYVFTIPFQRAILSWLFGITVLSLFLAAVAHLFNGSIQPEQNRVSIGTAVKVHVSALLGVLALLKAWAYRLDVFELVYSSRGVIDGASYTDVHAQRPALQLLFYIALVAAAVFFVNVFRFQGWVLPGAAMGLWVFVSVVAGGIVPAAVQRFQVTPNESERERPYIARNIAQTRVGFGLDRISEERFAADENLTAKEVADNAGTIDNVRVWDPTVLHPTYQRLQAIRTYYDFDDVDIDRYELDGKATQIMLAGREVDATKLPGAESWVNQKLSYTHGYGIVANPANAVTNEGLPQFVVRGFPPRGPEELIAREPGIYFGERSPLGSYVVAKTKQKEIDYSTGNEKVVTGSYKGQGGIELSSILRRLAFAVRFGDTDLAISNFIKSDSRLIMRRNILERVQTAAPFLQFDHDPYLVVADQKYYWVVDAYTTTDRFPYSQRVDLAQTVGGNLRGTANYMRNSVKVVVDAYNGTTNYYLVEPEDALAATYQKAFPTLFTPDDQMPASLRQHVRYPEDLFKVQAIQYRAYHIDEPQRLYEREDVWDIPNDPVHSTEQVPVAMDPYYVMMKLPGEDKEEFLLMLPFTPKGRPLLNGWVAARMDPGHYGELVGLRFPQAIDGPENVAARIEQDEVISRQFTLWQGAGSNVVRGNLLVVPIGDSIIYVQPIYLEAAESARALPELRRVIVVAGDRIGFESTFQKSLESVMRGRAPTVEEGEAPARPREDSEPEPAAPTGDVGELLDQAVKSFERAEEALRDGDLATYQRENEAGRRAVEEARSRGG